METNSSLDFAADEKLKITSPSFLSFLFSNSKSRANVSLCCTLLVSPLPLIQSVTGKNTHVLFMCHPTLISSHCPKKQSPQLQMHAQTSPSSKNSYNTGSWSSKAWLRVSRFRVPFAAGFLPLTRVQLTTFYYNIQHASLKGCLQNK